MVRRTFQRRRRTAIRIAGPLSLLIVSLLTVASAGAEHVPSTPAGVIEFQGHARLFLDLDPYGAERLDPMVEAVGRIEGEESTFRYRALTAGTYFRVHRNVKAGAFYRLQTGARHDDDWWFLDPGWKWRNTNERLESVLIADLSPRFLLDFLPGRDWVVMVKNRYHYNVRNDLQTLLVRPTVTRFVTRNREPWLTLSAAYGTYFSLNFGNTTIYEHGPYASAIYHLRRDVMVEVSLAYRTTTWSGSEDLKRSGDTDYTVDYTRWVVGTGLIVRL